MAVSTVQMKRTTPYLPTRNEVEFLIEPVHRRASDLLGGGVQKSQVRGVTCSCRPNV